MFSRETLIALRARRRAYRIAVDFLFPHLDVPPAPPLANVVFPNRGEAERNQPPWADHWANRRWRWIEWMALAIALAIPITYLLAVEFGLMQR